jgi:DnaK suppressor protein
MRDDEVRKYKHLLIARRDELLKYGSVGSGVSHTVSEPADVGDQAKAAQETELTERLHQTNSHLLRAIQEALDRIKRGTFGVCAHCGRPIGRPRLYAVPWTRLCLNCKEPRA